MDCSTPAFPVLHHLPEFAQTHAHWVDNAILLSHSLSPLLLLPSTFPSIRVFSNISSSYQVSKVLELKGCKNSLRLLPWREKGLCWSPMNLGGHVTASISHSEIPRIHPKGPCCFNLSYLSPLLLGYSLCDSHPWGWEKSRQQERATCRYSSWSLSWGQPSSHPSPDAWCLTCKWSSLWMIPGLPWWESPPALGISILA